MTLEWYWREHVTSHILEHDILTNCWKNWQFPTILFLTFGSIHNAMFVKVGIEILPSSKTLLILSCPIIHPQFSNFHIFSINNSQISKLHIPTSFSPGLRAPTTGTKTFHYSSLPSPLLLPNLPLLPTFPSKTPTFPSEKSSPLPLNLSPLFWFILDWFENWRSLVWEPHQ